jgi:hypothetical protein
MYKENHQMRKRIYTRNVGVLLTEDIYQQLIDITDELEVTISEYVRDLLVNKLKENEKEI